MGMDEDKSYFWDGAGYAMQYLPRRGSLTWKQRRAVSHARRTGGDWQALACSFTAQNKALEEDA